MVGSVCLKFRLNLNISNLDECTTGAGIPASAIFHVKEIHSSKKAKREKKNVLMKNGLGEISPHLHAPTSPW